MDDKDMNVSDQAIQGLSDQIGKLDKKVDRKIGAVNRSFTDFKKEVTDKLQPFHEYILVQTEKEKWDKESEKSKGTRGSGLNANPDLIKLAIILASALIAALGLPKVL